MNAEGADQNDIAQTKLGWILAHSIACRKYIVYASANVLPSKKPIWRFKKKSSGNHMKKADMGIK